MSPRLKLKGEHSETRVHTSRSIKRGFQRRYGTSVIFVPSPSPPLPPTKLTLRHVLATQGENSLRNYRSIGARSDLTRGVESSNGCTCRTRDSQPLICNVSISLNHSENCNTLHNAYLAYNIQLYNYLITYLSYYLLITFANYFTHNIHLTIFFGS